MIFNLPDCSHRAENRSSHGQVEARALFTNVSRCEVDGYGFAGITEAGIEQRRLDALAALLHRSIGHTHRDEVPARARRIHVYLDIDQMRINALNGRTEGTE